MTTGSPGADSSNLVTRLIDGKPMVVLGMKGKQLSIFCAYVLVLSGCDGSSKTSEATLARTEEERLVHDPLRAAPILTQRLRDAVQMRDGVLMVDSDSDLYLLPMNSPWVVNCGFLGIRAIFGNSVGADESARNDTTVILDQAAVDKMDCRTLVPVVGKAMQAVLSGH